MWAATVPGLETDRRSELMIEIYCKPDIEEINITNFVKSVSNSGDSSLLSRKLSITLAHPIWDKNQPQVNLPLGSKIRMILDGEEIFNGILWIVESNSNEELILTAYDFLIYLNKSKVTYNFTNIKPEDAVKKICSELGVETGDIEQTGVAVSNLVQQQTACEAILGLYDMVTLNGYLLTITKTKINVIRKGQTITNYTLTINENGQGNNVISNDYTSSLEDMINMVKIYDDKNNCIGVVEDEANKEKYGILQENYTAETGKDSNIEATKMLKSIGNSCSVEALGNWQCKTGFVINTKIFYLDSMKNASFLIDGDTHTWDIGTNEYTMQLNLVTH